MIPSLPAQDPDPSARRAQLARARETWRITARYASHGSPGIALAEEVPIRDCFSAGFGGEVSRVSGAVLLNQLLTSVTQRFSGTSLAPSRQDWLDVACARRHPEKGLAAATRAANRPWTNVFPANERGTGTHHAASLRFPVDLSQYLDLYASISMPELVEKFARPSEFHDKAFAWQRIAGANPMVLERWCAGSTPLPFDESSYARAVGGEDSLVRALEEGRLYVADYELLDGLPNGEVQGREKHVCAPLAWFSALPATRERLGCFVPIAVQCSRLARDVFFPWDGVKWMMARTAVQMADSNLQEMVYHLGRTHLVMEAVILTARRNLAANHPLMVLLEPHFEFTLAINDYASRHLIAPGGDVDRLLASTLEGSLSLTAKALRTPFTLFSPARDFAHRKVDDREALPDYPYRDDALLVWSAIRRFVERYVRVYYESDAHVGKDVELAAFCAALVDKEAGRLTGVGPMETIDDLIEFVSTILFTASAQHSALNFAQFPLLGFAPNAPAALYAPPPRNDADSSATDPSIDDWLDMLPPPFLALPQFTLLYQLSSVRWNRLGHYSPLQFLDYRVWEALLRFRWDLESVEAQILARDASRFLSYPFLLPSKLGSSVFI